VQSTALPIERLLERLNAVPEAPWADRGPAGLTGRRLGILLADYGISSHNSRFPDGTQRKGYTRADFTDAWTRYCPHDLDPPEDAWYPSQPSQPQIPWSARDGSPPWDGSTRPTDPIRPGLTSTNDGGTDGTGTRPDPGCPHQAGTACLDCWTARRATGGAA